MASDGEHVTAVLRSDGTVVMPVVACTEEAIGDGAIPLCPGDPGYAAAAEDAIPVDAHPLRHRDPATASRLDALFTELDGQQQMRRTA